MFKRKKSRPARTAHIKQQAKYSPIETILSRLHSVKKTAPDKWTALCPAHDDRRPSLSIREAEDSKVLLKCWTGCGAAEIVNALGLSMADLFPKADRNNIVGTGPMRQPFNYRDALTALAHEISVALILIERRGELDDEDLARLAIAQERVEDGLRAAGGVR